MRVKPGVIFDMDGVIVHSNPAHKKAIQIFCEKHNKKVSEKFLQTRLYGRTNSEWIPELFGDLDGQRLNELADEKERLFRDMFTPERHIVEGLFPFLRQLGDRDIPMAVATSAPGTNAEYILSRLAIEDHFASVLDSSHVSKGKPDPEVYLKSAASLQREPGQCIIFEDSVSGVQAGRAAGSVVVGVTTTHTAEELEQCHFTIHNFTELDVETLLDLSRRPA